MEIPETIISAESVTSTDVAQFIKVLFNFFLHLFLREVNRVCILYQ